MIVDTLDNWSVYFNGPNWQMVGEFLRSLGADTPDGEYPIKGDEIFARVMSYETKDPDSTVLEAHRSYIDIQSVVCGAEAMAWCPLGALLVREPYDGERDAEFYLPPEHFPATVEADPGLFVALFPEDAHMTQLKLGGVAAPVKKVVVKVHRSLI